MEPADAHILDTVVAVVTRYGMKRTTMAHVAGATGVSRQTLYDRFGDKDGVMAAAIDLIADRVCQDLRAEFATERNLAAQLDAYFRVGVWPTYTIIQAMPDAADFEIGMGESSIAAIRRAGSAKQALLADVLRTYLPRNDPPPEHVAQFVEQTSCHAKMSGMAPEDLAQFLSVLKASTLALAATT